MEDEHDEVAALLRSMQPPEVRGDFVARVNARIDATAGWLGLADFRVWTIRLAPALAALLLVAVFWQAPASSASTASTSTDAAAQFSPASSTDWQQDVSGDALLDAALAPEDGGRGR